MSRRGKKKAENARRWCYRRTADSWSNRQGVNPYGILSLFLCGIILIFTDEIAKGYKKTLISNASKPLKFEAFYDNVTAMKYSCYSLNNSFDKFIGSLNECKWKNGTFWPQKRYLAEWYVPLKNLYVTYEEIDNGMFDWMCLFEKNELYCTKNIPQGVPHCMLQEKYSRYYNNLLLLNYPFYVQKTKNRPRNLVLKRFVSQHRFLSTNKNDSQICFCKIK